jgi:hypothetical protein
MSFGIWTDLGYLCRKNKKSLKKVYIHVFARKKLSDFLWQLTVAKVATTTSPIETAFIGKRIVRANSLH